MYKILVVEDDDNLRNQVSQVLKTAGYEVFVVENFQNVLENVSEIMPDLVILDINLPVMDGNYFCHAITSKYNIPVLITSARNGDMDQILGMELGADDYIIKPFNINVLVSRIAAVLRRTYDIKGNKQLFAGSLFLDEGGMKIKYGSAYAELSKNEFKLIRILMEKKDQVVSREELLDELWDDKNFIDDNTLTVNITRLKKTLETLGLNDIILTKRGVGYLFSSDTL